MIFDILNEKECLEAFSSKLQKIEFLNWVGTGCQMLRSRKTGEAVLKGERNCKIREKKCIFSGASSGSPN